ncbi:1512_t:CDS:2 [Rhizophagus irregularis]|nr:1512_t:CDS:2 [Rhizophagus irregularis]
MDNDTNNSCLRLLDTVILDFVIGLIEHRFLDNNTNCKLSG